VKHGPRARRRVQAAPTAALPAPPASRPREKSRCSFKPRQAQNRTRRDPADRGQGREPAGTPAAVLGGGSPVPPETEQGCRRRQRGTPRGQPPHVGPARGQDRPAANEHRLVPAQPGQGLGIFWESDPASHVSCEGWLGARPEATREPVAAGPLPLNPTTFSIPNESWT